jgi:hypothetical protein
MRCETLRDDQTMRESPLEWDECLYKSDQEEIACHFNHVRKETTPDTGSTGTLILDLPASWTVDNKFLSIINYQLELFYHGSLRIVKCDSLYFYSFGAFNLGFTISYINMYCL